MAAAIRVLLIEDSSDDALLAVRALERAGLAVYIDRVDSLAALEAALRGGTWDVVCSDHSMPGFDAPAALALVRRLAPDVPIILVSGTIGEERAVAAIKAGAYDYVPKGSLARLPDTIQRALRETAERRARALAEEVARRTTDQLSALHDASPIGIVTLDAAGRVATWNRAAERIFGRNVGDAAGQPLPLDAAALEVFERLRRRTHHGDMVSDVELETRRLADGHALVLSCSTAPLRDASGEVAGLVAVFADVTRRRELEHHLHLTQRLEALGRLAGGIAHDFNNLLTAILGTAQVLMEDLGDDRRAEDARDIKDAAVRAAALTRQLLAFSRRQMLQPEVLDLNALVLDLEKMLRRLLGEDIELRTTLAADLGAVRADPSQVEQVIVNLSINARDAMGQGGVLSIATENAFLHEPPPGEQPSVNTGPYVLLTVSDTGSGMDEATRSRVFEPFFTTKERGQGTGLGLAMVYGIVKQSGGYIWVFSEPGRGSTFRVYLPRVGEKPVPLAVRAPEGGDVHGSETVLVVEDEEPVRMLAQRLLVAKGYTVLTAAGGDEALAVAADAPGPVSLLLTDVVMPGMSGRELASRLADKVPGMKVLYMSGYTDDDIVRHGVLDPRTPFLPKPFTPDGLLRKIRDVLDG
jgi:PAS domain S-box-containing protein